MALLFRKDQSVNTYDAPIESLDKKARVFEDAWRRDYENESTGIIGNLRNKIREVKLKDFPDGLGVKVNHLTFTSPPLRWKTTGMCEALMRPFDLLGRLRASGSSTNNTRVVLSDISFELPKKSMTLIIGSPGSGKV